MLGIALVRPSLTMQLTGGRDTSLVCASKGRRQTLRATIVTIFSHMTRDISVLSII